MRPTIAEIHLDALLANYKALEHRVEQSADPGAGLLAVVKADAYGHGVERCAQALVRQANARWLGVTSADEALRLRAALFQGVDGPGHIKPNASGLGTGSSSHDLPVAWKRAINARILIMSGFFPGEAAEVVRLGLRPLVWEPWHLQQLDHAARSARYPAHTVPVHLEIDTGMSRQGVAPADAAALLSGTLPADSPIWVEGVMTHFSSPEVLTDPPSTHPAGPITDHQLALFTAALASLREAGVRPLFLHAGNSANAGTGVALSRLAQLAAAHGAQLLVRPGLALYGIPTRFAPSAPDPIPLRPVLQWRTAVTSLREVAPGTPVGYNETFRAARRARLATVPVGYADGLRRELSNRGAMLVRGLRAPIVGRVSMDQTVLDITHIPAAALGEEVVILGEQRGSQNTAHITAWDHADWCGTIPYEVVCGIAPRVARSSTDL